METVSDAFDLVRLGGPARQVGDRLTDPLVTELGDHGVDDTVGVPR